MKLFASLLLFVSVLGSQPLNAEELNPINLPWSRAGIGVGYFITALDTDLRFGSGVAINIDAEQILGMEGTSSVFKLDAFWRFSKNQRHRLDINWFSLNREGSREVGTDITIEDPDGIEVQILDSSTVKSYFDLDLYQGVYSYSLFFDDRLDIALKTGLYVAPIKMGLESTGFTETKTKEAFTAPLPTFGLRVDIAVTPKWFLRSGTDVFYLVYDEYVGYILSYNAAIEYQPWKHIGIGAGFDTFNLHIESDGEDYPGIDLKGEMEFRYVGLLLYVQLHL